MILRPHASLFWILLLFTIVLPLSIAAQTAPNLRHGLALDGYDPVAYRDLQEAVKGSPDLAFTYQGATYHFATSAHRATFIATPELYLPAYGGWCAYAIGKSDELVSVDPKTFKVINGRVYLFYNGIFGNTLPKWNAEEAMLKARADANWAGRRAKSK